MTRASNTATVPVDGVRVSKRRRGIGLILCLLTIVLAILDQNIVSAAIVPIVRDLDPAHGLEHVAWLVTAFALAATVVLPLYGRLCDLLGAKRVYLTAIATFLVGSVLCGAAQTMTQLIAFRALQGIGAGGLMSVTMVVIAQLREPGDSRGPSGLAGVVAGIGLAIGPLVGGLLADHGNWRWVFYFNVPLGVVILVGAILVLRLPRRTESARLDFAGAALAAAFASAVLLVCDWGGKPYAWTSPTILVLAAAAVLCLGLFIWRQATAAEPILPLALFTNTVVRRAYLVQGLVAVAMTAALVYLMVYLQIGRGMSATDAGAFLAFMALGLALSGIVTSRVTLSIRAYLVPGTLLAAAALTAMSRLAQDTPLWMVRVELVVLGLGLGQVLGRLIQVIQSAAPPAQLGVATTAIRFFQSLGGAAGAALFGSLLTRAYEAEAASAGAPGVSMSGIAAATRHVRAVALTSFVDSVDVVFAGTAVVMALALVFAVRLKEAPTAEPVEAAGRELDVPAS